MLSKTLRTIAIGFSIVALSGSDSGASSDKNIEDTPLENVADIPIPGPAVRFDYQSLDQSQGRLYISHMIAALQEDGVEHASAKLIRKKLTQPGKDRYINRHALKFHVLPIRRLSWHIRQMFQRRIR